MYWDTYNREKLKAAGIVIGFGGRFYLQHCPTGLLPQITAIGSSSQPLEGQPLHIVDGLSLRKALIRSIYHQKKKLLVPLIPPTLSAFLTLL